VPCEASRSLALLASAAAYADPLPIQTTQLLAKIYAEQYAELCK
jgi:hypothetical protein